MRSEKMRGDWRRDGKIQNNARSPRHSDRVKKMVDQNHTYGAFLWTCSNASMSISKDLKGKILIKDYHTGT